MQRWYRFSVGHFARNQEPARMLTAAYEEAVFTKRLYHDILVYPAIAFRYQTKSLCLQYHPRTASHRVKRGDHPNNLYPVHLISQLHPISPAVVRMAGLPAVEERPYFPTKAGIAAEDFRLILVLLDVRLKDPDFLRPPGPMGPEGA